MALTRTQRFFGIGFVPEPGNSTAYVSSSFTPTANSKLVVCGLIEYYSVGGSPIVNGATISDSVGLTWTRRSFADNSPDTYVNGYAVWEADVGSSPSSMTVTLTPGATKLVAGMLVLDYTSDAGTVVLTTNSGYQASGSTGTLTATLASAPASSSEVIGVCVAYADGLATVAAGTGFSEVAETNTASFIVFQYQSRTGSTSTSVPWGVTFGGSFYETVGFAFEVAEETAAVVIDSVTPDTFADAETGIVIAGSEFGASQGAGRVVISPVDDIDGESTIGASYFGGASGGTNPTTSTTLTIPASLPPDCVLCLHFTSRDHTSGTGQPTVSDNNSGASWTQRQFTTDRKAQWWWKRYESGLSGKTITISGAVGSLSARLVVIDDAYETGDPFTDFAEESNASGNEDHAAITPTNAGSAVVFAVYNYANDNAVSSVSAATTGAPGESTGHLSTGGSDCATHAAVWNNHPASSSGSITWAQTNGTTYSHAYAVRPRAPIGAAVEQTVTSWGDTSITFTADKDTLSTGVNLYLFVENDGGISNAAGEVVQFEAGAGGFQAAWARGSNVVLH